MADQRGFEPPCYRVVTCCSSFELLTDKLNTILVVSSIVNNGAAPRIRTQNHPLTRRLLYHWSYHGVCCCVLPLGIEPSHRLCKSQAHPTTGAYLVVTRGTRGLNSHLLFGRQLCRNHYTSAPYLLRRSTRNRTLILRVRAASNQPLYDRPILPISNDRCLYYIYVISGKQTTRKPCREARCG